MQTMLLGMVLLLSACGPDSFLDRRDMYADIIKTPKIRLEVDWLSHFGEKPTGMTVLMNGIGGNNFSTVTNSVDGIDLTLNADSYPTLVYNLSEDEFGSLDFHNADSYDSIHVTLTPITMRSNEAWDKEVRYLREPEKFGVALDTINITDEMVKEYSAHIRQRLSDGYTGDRADTVMYVFHETVYPVVSTLNVYVKVKGITNAKSVEGNITNMADGFYPTQLHATTGKCTHLLDNWKMHLDKENSKDGYITTTIQTFGLPHGTEDVTNRDSTLNYLTLYFKLADGKTTKEFVYPVGNLFKYTGTNTQKISAMVSLELDLTLDAKAGSYPELPDVKSDDTGTGFDATVDDWDDGGTSDISL